MDYPLSKNKYIYFVTSWMFELVIIWIFLGNNFSQDISIFEIIIIFTLTIFNVLISLSFLRSNPYVTVSEESIQIHYLFVKKILKRKNIESIIKIKNPMNSDKIMLYKIRLRNGKSYTIRGYLLKRNLQL
ncbi:MAG: Uncharacterised protein [Flavobacteriales bacterium UBA4585]|nr:MAG: Uncharacterised protein [Flavobacteriales bacterium UBA4585]